LLATSLGLSPSEKDNIMNLCQPYILSPGDVLGRNDLNNLLSRHPNIERQNFKLWMTSIPIFEEILHSKVKNASRDELERIREHAKYYVHNKSFGRALKILDEHNVCIVAGIPGIGKTILSEMLSLYFVNLGYEVVKVTGDISEASALDYVNTKRLFYYDDFLGQTSLSEKLNKNEDQRLLDFIYAIRRSKVSKLILTTREYILNQAKMVYEKLALARFNFETCIIDLSFYTRKIRAQILYNHLYFSDLPESFKRKILVNEQYLKVIDHRNYNPRIVQFMTDPLRIAGVRPSNYWIAFCSNLDNPTDIWKHAFEQQISRESRNLLLILATLPMEVFREDAEAAFDIFHKDQAKAYGYDSSSRDFEHALRELEGSFIITNKSKDRIFLKFHNPSVRDFLDSYIIQDYRTFKALICSSIFHEQLSWLWNIFHKNKKIPQFTLNAEEIVNNMLRRNQVTMIGSSCQLINLKNSDGSISKTIWSISYERKAVLLLTIINKFPNATSDKFLEQLLDAIDMRINNKQAHREDLVEFLKEAKSFKIFDSKKHKNILLHAKEYLRVSDIGWFDDFRAFCDFADLFSGLVTTHDLNTIKGSFEYFAEDISLSHDESDPDSIRGNAAELQSIGERLDINVSNYIERMEDRAAEIEEEAASQIYDDYDHDSYSGSDDYCSDNEIKSMFSTM
jgi:hypothetical protein